MHNLHKFIMVVGVMALGRMAFHYFTHARRGHHEESQQFSGRGHRLGASNETQVDDVSNFAPVFSSLSVAIWGMVIAKAKTGMEAATKNDSATVGGLLKKTGFVIAMIVAASVFQLMAAMNTTTKAAAAPSHGKKLQAGRFDSHPASYYDQTSSHYMGGAHNALLMAAKMDVTETKTVETPKSLTNANSILVSVAKESMSTKKAPMVSSQKSMGGAHNVAMAVLTEQSRQFKSKFQQARSTSRYSTQLNEKNLRETGRFVAFIATLALCVASFVTVKTYHAHLEKQDTLNALLKNPNARVASQKKGREIVQKFKDQTEATAEITPTATSDLEHLIVAAKAKKVLRAAAVEEQSERLLNGYQPPQAASIAIPQQTVYTLEPQASPQPVQ